MKVLCVILIAVLMFCGCARTETFETVSDDLVLSAMAQPRQIELTLPEDTVLPAMESENGILYLCSGYDVAVQTMEGGDLDSTIRQISGYGREDLTVMETANDGLTCYEFVWTSAGELGEQVGRASILDDGTYHYVLTATADADDMEEYREIWNGLFETFRLS